MILLTLEWKGIIVDGCSLVGNGSIREILVKVGEVLSLDYDVAHNTKVGMFMANIYQLSLTNVTIQNNRGIGLLAINIMGNSNLQSVVFSNNTPNECIVQLYQFVELADSTAGGLFLLYTDYQNEIAYQNVTASLHIDQSLFQYNQQCGIFSTLPIVSSTTSSPSVQSLGFSVGGGAGMGIVLSQIKFPCSSHSFQFTIQRERSLTGWRLYWSVSGIKWFKYFIS